MGLLPSLLHREKHRRRWCSGSALSCCAAKLAEPGRGTPEDPELNINFYISLFNSSRYKFLALQMDHNNVLTISWTDWLFLLGDGFLVGIVAILVTQSDQLGVGSWEVSTDARQPRLGCTVHKFFWHSDSISFYDSHKWCIMDLFADTIENRASTWKDRWMSYPLHTPSIQFW